MSIVKPLPIIISRAQATLLLLAFSFGGRQAQRRWRWSKFTLPPELGAIFPEKEWNWGQECCYASQESARPIHTKTGVHVLSKEGEYRTTERP